MESFKGSFRNEYLNARWFLSLDAAAGKSVTAPRGAFRSLRRRLCSASRWRRERPRSTSSKTSGLGDR
ncbi:hypothetical protein EHF33_18885 (plasmid) [Deinococcus psychrotolerans]|uniref:Uncharacterized protein n=1 Tax=Deinococcus psychrotolerans TaxID=2489213 RepID=A0A3G8YIN2_9DEIO|nr:hypothetical protein EHF33_18885 [Deinococcus psychrotolerans]